MFYRRKVILALLQIFDGQLDKISLQKLLFLISKKQVDPTYDFIPYKFGCYSYSANADLTTMVAKGQLTETDKGFKRSDATNYLKSLAENDKKIVLEIKAIYGKMSASALIKHTYINYPYWAINSEIAEQHLNTEQLQRVRQAKITDTQTILFTIGYEGISLEEYLNRLVRNDVRVLVDVRRNPISQKFGFSKNQLTKYCASLDIKYVHIPEVGIPSDLRQELKTQADYDKLFVLYRKGLPAVVPFQQQIFNLLETEQRIALTCFEANTCQCHRTHLAESITNFSNFRYVLKHI